MAIDTIYTRFLNQLGVPHTADYSNAQFRNMSFKSLFGLQTLLKEYDIDSYGLKLNDKAELSKLTPPFLAATSSGLLVIVTAVNSDAVTFDSFGRISTLPTAEFNKQWNGNVFLAFPNSKSREPEYAAHRTTEIVRSLSKYALIVAGLVIFAYFFVTRGVYAHVSTVLLTLLNCAGIYLSFMLLQKSLNIHTHTSDRVCGILEQGGCDSIMASSVSKLFGVFSWSEVGFGYFGVSLATLLIFPHLWPALAVCNLCCLPYTVWSIWYQRFRAHHWCTLCVGVQSTLWLLFFCYLGGGWLKQAFPLKADLIVLMAVYVFAVLLLNFILTGFRNIPLHENNPRT